MSNTPHCPECDSENAYPDRNMLVCPMCAHEWNPEEIEKSNDSENVIKDANGNVLQDGDSVTVIKELKVNGSSTVVVKAGTKVKGIRLVDGDDGHDISCKIKGIGSMHLKSEFVKKSK